jgi:hypothetical protein
MHIATPTEASAAVIAEREARWWARTADRWSGTACPELWADRPATEAAVVLFHDPAADLERRADRWGHSLSDHGLDALAEFAAGLAAAEGEAWRSGHSDVAVRAFEDRRFLLADRILHWAVPWLETVGRCYPEQRKEAHADREGLLDVAETMRAAPRLAGPEGVYPSGEDAFGPTELDVPLARWMESVWSGSLILDATRRSMGDPDSETLVTLYEVDAARWRRLAVRYPGSAALWHDLGDRAEATAAGLRAEPQGAGPDQAPVKRRR